MEHLIFLYQFVRLFSLFLRYSKYFWYLILLRFYHLLNALLISLNLPLHFSYLKLLFLWLQFWRYDFLKKFFVLFLKGIVFRRQYPCFFCRYLIFFLKDLHLSVTLIFIKRKITNCFQKLFSLLKPLLFLFLRLL